MKHYKNNGDWLTLFESLDVSGVAFPHGFEASLTEANFKRFAQALNELCPDTNTHISLQQDSTSFATLGLPASLFPGSHFGGSLILSSFGGLLSLQEPGVSMRPEDKNLLSECANVHEYLIIDPLVEEAIYTGVHSGFETWGDRFFGYL